MVFSSPIFRKLLASAFVVIALTLAVLDFYLTRYTSKHEVQEVEQRLTAVARVLAAEPPNLPLEQMEEWAKSASVRAQSRVTVIDLRVWCWLIPTMTPRVWRTTRIVRRFR